jgi:hypothetical protein
MRLSLLSKPPKHGDGPSPIRKPTAEVGLYTAYEMHDCTWPSGYLDTIDDEIAAHSSPDYA